MRRMQPNSGISTTSMDALRAQRLARRRETAVRSLRQGRPMIDPGLGLLSVPGFGLPFDYQPPDDNRFAQSIRDWRQPRPISNHELQMAGVISLVTDVQDWQRDIFDDSIARDFYASAKSRFPGFNDREWDRCLAKLRNMAAEYDEHKPIRSLTVGICVCKSATLLPQCLLSELADSMEPIFTDHLRTRTLRWPTSIDVVDPYICPLVYGSTRVLQDGGLTDLADMYGTREAKRAPDVPASQPPPDPLMRRITRRQVQQETWYDLTEGSEIASLRSRSMRFQRLPCEVKSGLSAGSVRITSYINNLHPRHGRIYHRIEEIISQAIALWGACLVRCRKPTPPQPESARSGHGRHGQHSAQMLRPARSSRYDFEYTEEIENHKSLQDYLRISGLQVIIEIGGVELPPGSRPYSQDEWRSQHRPNEHIVATAVVVFSVENLKPCYISFRRDIEVSARDENGRGDSWNPSWSHSASADAGSTVHRTIERAELRLGRLITFPNVVKPYLESLELADPAHKGHFRTISIHLVDPNCRICSTANVPAQQYEWWLDTVEGLLHRRGLPAELCQSITQYCEQDRKNSGQGRRTLPDPRMEAIAQRLRRNNGPG